MADGRNAWRKMTPEQRRAFLNWIEGEGLDVAADLFPTTWTPIRSEPIDVPGPPSWFVCKGSDDHGEYFDNPAEAAVCAAELNLADAIAAAGGGS